MSSHRGSLRWSRWMSVAALAAGAVLMAAWSAGGAPKPEPKAEQKAEQKAEKKPAAAAEKCRHDADCALVADDCCPCSAGGKQRAMARKHVDAYEKARAQRCGGTMCAEMMSQDPSCDMVAVCEGGTCRLGAAKKK